MKTVLYRPVFINPQAYYVFPQLATLEPKTTDFIEPAVFVGKLVVQFDDSLEYVAQFENTKEIDLKDFAGDHIRISQITDLGSVVLGEWILPGGTKLVPSVKIPDMTPGIRESMVLWYSIAKQGADPATLHDNPTLYDLTGNGYHAKCEGFEWNINTVNDGALYFDGVDSMCVTEGLPTLEDYTIVVKRKWLDDREERWLCSLGTGNTGSVSESLFWLEGGRLVSNDYYTYSKAYKNPISMPELFTIQITSTYNGQHINTSTGVQQGDKLFIGCAGNIGIHDTHYKMALYELILFNRTLTPEEQQIVLQQILECDVCKYTYTAQNATVHVFREGVKELTTDDYIYPGETLYVTARVSPGYAVDYYVIDNLEYKWEDNKPIAITVPDHSIDIIALAEYVGIIKDWEVDANTDLTQMDVTMDVNADSVAFSGSTNNKILQLNLNQNNISSFDIAATTLVDGTTIGVKVDDSMYSVTTQAKTYSNFNSASLLYVGSTDSKVSVQFTNIITK